MSRKPGADVFDENFEIAHDEPAVPCNLSEFEKVVRSRRSVRKYTDEPIPEETIRNCLDLALLAPNSSNLQCWEFYWIRNSDKKKELADYCLGQSAATTAQELIVCVARLDTWNRNRKQMLELFQKLDKDLPDAVMQYYERIVPLAYSQGWFYLLSPFKRLLFFLLSIFRPMVRGPSSRADMRVWAHKTTALACQNLMLSLRASGLDSCPMEGFDGPRIRRLLDLPRAAEICMVVSAGKRADNGVYGEQIRLEKSHFVFEV